MRDIDTAVIGEDSATGFSYMLKAGMGLFEAVEEMGLNPDTDEKVPVELRLRKKIKVKQSDSEKQTRYMVEMWITLGKIRSLVEVTLSDRDHMEYPLLIGRNMLVDTMIVDVSARHTAK